MGFSHTSVSTESGSHEPVQREKLSSHSDNNKFLDTQRWELGSGPLKPNEAPSKRKTLLGWLVGHLNVFLIVFLEWWQFTELKKLGKWTSVIFTCIASTLPLSGGTTRLSIAEQRLLVHSQEWACKQGSPTRVTDFSSKDGHVTWSRTVTLSPDLERNYWGRECSHSAGCWGGEHEWVWGQTHHAVRNALWQWSWYRKSRVRFLMT